MSVIFEFGPFRLDARERTLQREGAPISLTPKAFDVLEKLLARHGRLVPKDDLLHSVWGGVHVDEGVLTRAISDVRKALGQGEGQIYIETVPKYGYRFIAPVNQVPAVPRSDCEEAPGGRAFRWSRGTWVGAAALAVAAVLVVVVPWWVSLPPEPRRLAVLPFQFIGQPGGDPVLGMAIADALITRLGSLEGLIVRPLAAVRRFERHSVDTVQVARELSVDAVLEGTLQQKDGRVRASVRLLRAEDGKALWSETLEAPSDRLFILEDTLAHQAALKLALRLGDEDRRNLAQQGGFHPEAHRLYVNGRYEWGRRTRAGFEKAAEHFRQAIDLDPGYARAYAGLADCYLLLGGYAHHPQLETLPKAKAAALRALDRDPRLAEAHATLGLITQNLDWDWTAAERHYREAIRLAPNYATARHWYAEFLSILGRFDESEREFEHARRIDPLSPIIPVDEAQLLFFERRYDRALAELNAVAQADPSFALVHERMALVYLAQEREADAWREAMRLPECAEGSSDCRAMWSAWLPHLDPSRAREGLARLEAGAREGRIPDYALLIAYIRQGRAGQALDQLERMVTAHGVMLITAKVNPLFDPLRGEPRMQAVLARLNL